MKKRLLSLLLALVILSSVVSVIPAHAEDDKIPTHTIMLYAIGTDLESDSGCFTFNLKQIARSAYNENVSFIVMTGGAKKWQTESEYLSGAEEISAEYNQIWRITGKENGEKHGKMTLLEGSGLPGLEKTAMSDPAVLTGFIDYCYENYKSDCYDIILWDHGGGPAHGYGNDARGGYLSLCDLYDAFSSCKLIKDGKRFEIIDFDACLMASAEVIAALGGFTDYFVGSAETEPGTGQEYYSWLTTLNLEPYIDGATLASYIVESTLLYYNYNTQFVEDATLSAVNTKNFFEKVLPGLIMTDDILISEARTKSEKNGKYNFYDEIYSLDCAIAYNYGDYSLYDLGNLLCALSVTQTEFDRLDDAEIESVSNAYTDTVSELIKTLSDDDVIFTKSTKSLKKAVNIEYTRNMDGQIVWREADTIELKPTGLNVFFGTSSISETRRYVKEAAELLKRLPESDAKEFIKKNAVSAAYYSIISSFGYYTSMLAEDDEEYVDFTTVRLRAALLRFS